MGVPFFANRETLRDVREQELREACRILGADVRLTL
jgi:LmbE family N-acetylglucosaminyl deacetylase